MEQTNPGNPTRMASSEQQQPIFQSDLKSFLTYRLSKLQNNLNAQGTALLKKHCDLSLTEWRIISLLNHADEATIADLTRASRIDKGQLSRNTKKLISKAYVVTKPHETDNRQQLLSLSAAGLALYSRMRPHMIARQTQLAGNLSPQEIDALDSLLDKLNQAALEMRNEELE